MKYDIKKIYINYYIMYNNIELEIFHKNLNNITNKKKIILSQYFFYTSMILPFILYHSNNNNFPCTLSDTISNDTPRIIHHINWLLGWLFLLKVIFNSDSNNIKFFSIGMVSTGIIACMLYPINRKINSNKIHYFSSLLYMILHVGMFKILNIKKNYLNYFYLSFFFLFISSLKNNSNKIKKLNNFIFMISEYLLFFSFISGMTSNFTN